LRRVFIVHCTVAAAACQPLGQYSLTLAAFKHTLLIDSKYTRALAAAATAAGGSITGMLGAFNFKPQFVDYAGLNV